MVIEQQVINKIISDQGYEKFKKMGINSSYFTTFPEEYAFIAKHYDTYGETISPVAFIERFPEFEAYAVNDSYESLFDRMNEERTYKKGRPLLEKVAEMMEKGDSIKAMQLLKTEVDLFDIRRNFQDVDIKINAKERYENYLNRVFEKDFISTGFAELDEIISGYHRGEELVLWFARTNEGKTWAVLQSLELAWQQGETVGFITPEMSPERVGYRTDTIATNLSNQDLIRGIKTEQEEYEKYIQSLEDKKGFKVISKKGFPNKDVTVTAIKNWVVEREITFLCIDGISYIRDENAYRTDSKSVRLENISNDLMELSSELGIPIVIVAQANREGISKKTDDKKTPSLGTVRDSDGIAHNCSKVISIGTRDTVMSFSVEKNRDGIKGTTMSYSWNPNRAIFTYMADNEYIENNQEKKEELQNKYKDTKIPF